MNQRTYIIVSIVFVTVIGFLYFVWPTPWDYRIQYKKAKGHGGTSVTVEVPIRINRFTGVLESEDRGVWDEGEIEF